MIQNLPADMNYKYFRYHCRLDLQWANSGMATERASLLTAGK
jgi:hypothetical protein